MGERKSLNQITDDSRINIDAHEYERINRDFRYYRNLYPVKHYIDASGVRRKRNYNTINLTKRASQRIASIVFNEQCEIEFEDKTVNDFINQVLEDNDFKNQFEMNLEKGIVAGGFAMRPYVDNDKIKIAWVRADQFYPLRSNTNSISEAAIASRTTQVENNQTAYYTLLEFHQWNNGNYVITNELYRSTQPDIVGMQVNLNELYPDIEPQVIVNGDGMIRPLFSYFRMPGANNISLESPLGIGIVDNSKSTLDNLNLTHDSFMWEIRNGKRTVAVPESMLRFDTRQHRPMFDTDTDVYLKMQSQNDDVEIKDLTNDIRVQQFTDSMNAWLREFEGNIGVAEGTFSYNPSSGLQTATEVVSENSATYQTRSSILTNVTACINQLCQAILEIASVPEFFSDSKARFSIGDTSLKDLNDIGINVHYDDGVFVDKDKQMEEDLKNVVAGTLSKITFLQRNYGMSKAGALEELQNIQSETSNSDTPSGTETTLFGGGEGD